MSAISYDYAPVTAQEPEGRSVFRKIVDAMRRQIAIERNRRILHDMPDFMLQDIGIERAHIDDIVAGRLDHQGKPKGPYPF
jgi:uncharacterized protein YjiS (DUF1127 family)